MSYMQKTTSGSSQTWLYLSNRDVFYPLALSYEMFVHEVSTLSSIIRLLSNLLTSIPRLLPDNIYDLSIKWGYLDESDDEYKVLRLRMSIISRFETSTFEVFLISLRRTLSIRNKEDFEFLGNIIKKQQKITILEGIANKLWMSYHIAVLLIFLIIFQFFLKLKKHYRLFHS